MQESATFQARRVCFGSAAPSIAYVIVQHRQLKTHCSSNDTVRGPVLKRETYAVLHWGIAALGREILRHDEGQRVCDRKTEWDEGALSNIEWVERQR